MTLLQLRVLLAVAEQGGFTLAAERIGMSQPAVSRAVATLEDELGTSLFTRRRDGITLTEAGHRAVFHARGALTHFDLLRTEVAAIGGQVTGTLRLASVPSATGTLIAPQLGTFAERYPQVQVRLFEGEEPEVRTWLDQGAADVGVIFLPAPGREIAVLDTHEMVAALPAGHPLAGRPRVSISALAGQPFISSSGCGPVIMAAARNAGTRLDVAYEARELTAIMQMVGTGLGVSIVPTLGLPAAFDGVVIRPLEQPPTRTLAIALGSADSTPAARAFFDHVAEAAHPGAT
ncbi:LysR family transcriptional regulator [Pseudonocardia xinjiangensis]|uniref:LysR family transcriptional regulator n=1 Tax=Pseudonocardia xinjiangensis TaxID=75289 RepID=UPI003D8B0C3E